MASLELNYEWVDLELKETCLLASASVSVGIKGMSQHAQKDLDL